MKFLNSILYKFHTVFLIFIFLNMNMIKSDSVCDLELYILELKQDLEDNGILDCLRVIKPPNGVIETIDQKNKRLAAQWDTSCAFESSFDWLDQFKKNYGITTLVDEIGEPVSHNLPDQADMCEIFRAVVAAGLLSKITTDVTDIPLDALNYINCPGITDNNKICAVNGISYHKSDMWTIMINPGNLRIDDKPSFIEASESNLKVQSKPDPGIPIDRSDVEIANRLKSPSDSELTKLIASSKDFNKIEKKAPEDPWKKVYLKYSENVKETQFSNTGWKFWQSGFIDLKTNNDVYILGFSMISGFAMNSRLAVRLVLDEVSQISTRMIQGYLNYPSITTAFISHIQAGRHKIQTQYRASSSLHFDTDKNLSNLCTGIVVIPAPNLLLKKVINPSEIQLYNDNSWTDFPNLSTQVKFTNTSFGLIIYNISMPGMQSHIISRIDINTQPVRESRTIAGDSMYWGLHNAIVYKFLADVEYNVKVKYRTPYASKSNPRQNDWEAQSLMVLQLPEWVENRAIIVEEEFNLNCSGVWSLFPNLDIDLELEEDKTILFIYNVVVPLLSKEMTIGLFWNNVLEKKSIITYSSSMYFKALGYFPKKMSQGKYKIQLKYKTEACISYKPDTDWQIISMNILDMN